MHTKLEPLCLTKICIYNTKVWKFVVISNIRIWKSKFRFYRNWISSKKQKHYKLSVNFKHQKGSVTVYRNMGRKYVDTKIRFWNRKSCVTTEFNLVLKFHDLYKTPYIANQNILTNSLCGNLVARHEFGFKVPICTHGIPAASFGTIFMCT